MTEEQITMKQSVGRPSGYTRDHIPKVLALMAKGASIVEVAAELKVSKNTIYEWRKQHVEFAEAIEQGVELSQAWWEKVARQNVLEGKSGKRINGFVWALNMKNRFGWTDRRDVDLTSAGKQVTLIGLLALADDIDDDDAAAAAEAAAGSGSGLGGGESGDEDREVAT